MKLRPEIELIGFGGENLRELGMEILYPLPDLALIGFVEVARKLPKILHVRSLALRSWRERRPDAVLLVDYPGFHLPLARKAHEWGLPTLYYIAPQAWAWRESRVETLRKTLRRLYVIFPFEEPFFQRRGVPAQYVGHPLIERLPSPIESQVDHEERLERPLIGLLPGSRRNELRNHLPTMLKAARLLRERRPEARFYMPLAETLPEDFLRGFDMPSWIETGRDPDYRRRRELTAAWTASGTATVENALLEIPMAVIYRSGLINAFLARRLVRIPYIGMVNLIAEKGICPEFVQEQYQPDVICRWMDDFLASPKRYAEMKRDLRGARSKLGEHSASSRAAEALWADLQEI